MTKGTSRATKTPSELTKNVLKPLARQALGLLARLEDQLFAEAQLQHRPVFVVGVPRSGTTLLYQSITYALHTCYFTNLALRLRVQGMPQHPPAVLAAYIGANLHLIQHRPHPFQSNHGMSRGWGNPSDSVMLWQHWLPNRYVGANELTQSTKALIYQAVAGTEHAFGLPFVDKCTHNSVRIHALADVFPTALFVHCARNPLAVAQSLYLASTRQGSIAPIERWESARPREYKDLQQLDMIERICGQVFSIDQDIQETLAAIPHPNLQIQYQDLCANPQNLVARIAGFAHENGTHLELVRELPWQFDRSNKRTLDMTTYRDIIQHLERMYGNTVARLDETL